VTTRALAALLLVALAAPARGQVPAPIRSPKRGGGLWIDAGIAYGRLRLTCASCTTAGTANGTAVTISAGFTPAQNVLLGLQAQQWSSTGSVLRQRVRSVLAVVQWYPWPARGFFFRAGNGVVQGPLAAQPTATQPVSTQGTGVGFAIGLGYDFKVSRRLGLNVQAASHISALGDLTIDGRPAADVIAYVTRLGVAVVLR
jgi:hypothetical protein